ncbi:MAG TPA: ABC transporter ATP-binding protein [Gemmatimonadaceae bacterium]|nr:ABC transporter ATP-binding protein [Gemmatimonadaceae bacterium]
MTAKGTVQLAGVVLSYGDECVVHGVSLDIAPGEFVCLLGPSGCGKTTTLRAIAGLVAVDAGTIRIDGTVANAKPAHERGIGMVFQDLALFPHMTVERNIRFGLDLRDLDVETATQRVNEMLTLLRLSGLQGRLPRQLSGGQQQRVALARSLVVNPSVLLLDEPFAALDRKLREEMRLEIRALQRKLGITTVFVTHDQDEALTMADRVAVMNKGVIEQVGSPSEIYEKPANRFVLGFVGFSNFVRVEHASGPRATIAGVDCALGTQIIGGSNEVTDIALRPERVKLACATPAENELHGTLRSVAYEGALRSYDIVLADGQSILVREQNAMRAPRPQAGDSVTIAWHPNDAIVLTA